MKPDRMPLDPLSEMLAVSAYGNTKNVLATGVELKGHFDEEGVIEGFAQTAANYFPFQSVLKEAKEGGRYRLYWEKRPDIPYTVRRMTLPETDGDKPPLERFLEHTRQNIDRDWDLFNEPPVELHVARVSDDHLIAAPIIHHSACDGAIASEYGLYSFLRYCELMTGRVPDHDCFSLAISTAGKRRIRVNRKKLKNIKTSTRLAMLPFNPVKKLPKGSGDPNDDVEHNVKRILSLEDTEKIKDATRRSGVSLIDTLIVGADLAIDEWNAGRGIAPGTLTNSTTINMHGRYPEITSLNSSAVVCFKSRPEQRKDPQSFAKLIARDRMRIFRGQGDLMFFENVDRMNRTLGRLPFRRRKPLMNWFMQRQQLSMAVTLMGAIWPGTRNCKPSLDTCLPEVCGADVIELHGLGYKLLSRTHLLLIVYFFHSRLNLLLAAAGSHFTYDETNAFVDLVAEKVTSAYE
jgi:hypothetical protein